MFLAPWFLVGLAAAAGPLVIHLLNRQRYRVVAWAAMDFLQKAVRRSRRMLRLRDLLLLALRTACVVLFVLGMARPYWQRGATPHRANQPVHAVLVIDNSLSMSYTPLDRSLLDDAKARAAQFIDRLPLGSRISVLPLCGSERGFNLGAYSSKQDAKEALTRIEAVDRRGSAGAALDLAKQACRRVPEPAMKQVIFLSDHQRLNWPAELGRSQADPLPCALELVDVSAPEPENAWIEELRLLDGIADPSTPAIFLATVRYHGATARRDVAVTLRIDGVPHASQTVDLEPGQAREVRFPPYPVEAPTQVARPTFLLAEVSIPHDRLPGDDMRALAVPVVAGLPVVFVDQLGPAEDPRKNLFGETYRVRRLLAPVMRGEEAKKQLIQVRHVTIDRLDRQVLADARLVVIAGVASPGAAGPLLREYVEQGGRLILAAGADFDPAQWSAGAWEDGLGVLPAPLRPVPVGGLPGTAASPRPFQLDFASMVHDWFLLEQTPREELEDLFALPYFFKAVEPDLSEAVLAQAQRRMAEHLKRHRQRLAEIQGRLAELDRLEARGESGAAERQQRQRLEQELAHLRPDWLAWSCPETADDPSKLPADEAARRAMPRVLARYSNRVPFLVERRVGRGRVLMFTSGLFRDWNTLTTTNTVLLLDRICRGLIHETLPGRNLTTSEPLVLPVLAHERRDRFALVRPDGREESLAAGALAADRYGLTIGPLSQRGAYRVVAYGDRAAAVTEPGGKRWEEVLAVNGPAEESELAYLDAAGVSDRLGQAAYRWIGRAQPIALAGAGVQGVELWRWLILGALAGLLVELAILAWPSLVGGPTR